MWTGRRRAVRGSGRRRAGAARAACRWPTRSPASSSGLFQASARQADDDLVFADPHTGGPLDKGGILRRFRAALRAAHVDPSPPFHDLRHTFGTRMAAAGGPMRTLQEWMGHRDIETTQRYADYAPSANEAKMVAAAFGPRREARAFLAMRE